MSGSGGGSGSWKQQLHLAEKQYSDFFPDLELPSAQTQGDRDGGSLSQSQGASDPVDTSTLFNEDAFMTTILTLGIVALDKEELEAKNEEDTKLEASRRYSKTTINEMDAIDEIEGSLEQLISSIDRIKTVLLTPQFFSQKSLDKYKSELAQLGGDLDKLQFTQVDAIPAQPVHSGQEPVKHRRKSLNRRCLHLKDEFDETVEVLAAIQRLQDTERSQRAEQGLLYDDDGNLLRPGDRLGAGKDDDGFIDDAYHESLRIPQLDQLDPDWDDMVTLQKRLIACPIARRYVESMESQQLPLCDAVYEYLQDPSGHAYTLALCNLQLQPGEFEALTQFLVSSKKLRTEIRKLIFYNSQLDDQDCVSLSKFLPQFPNLAVLSLKHNSITSDGVGDIMRSLANSNGLSLEALYLDGNIIESVGVVEITIALPFCPLLSSISLSNNPIGDLGIFFLMRGLMNKKRKAIRTLPIPFGEEQYIFEMIRDFNLDFEDDEEVYYDGEMSESSPTTNQTPTTFQSPGSSQTPTSLGISDDAPVSHATQLSNGTTTNGTPEQSSIDLKKRVSESTLGSMMRRLSRVDEEGSDEVGGVDEAKENDTQVDTVVSFFDDGVSSIGAHSRHDENVIKDNELQSEESGQEKITLKNAKVDKWARLRLKLMAVAAFKALSQRGHALHTLKLEQCNLTSASALMIAHMLKDNNQLTDVILSNNQDLLSSPLATTAFAKLLANEDNRIRVLGLRGTGIGDDSMQQLTMGIKNKNSKHLTELDVSSGNMGSVGATWLAGCTRDMFFDCLSVSTVPSTSYAVDLL